MKNTSIKAAIIIPVLTVLIFGIIFMTVVVSIYSSNTVTELTGNLMETTVDKYSNDLTTLLAEVYGTVSVAAATIEGYLPGGNLRTFDDKRVLTVGILSDILNTSDQITAMWTCWEPNAFDGSDMFRANQDFHDSTGRFNPLIYRDENSFVVEALVNYDTQSSGMFYLGALESGRTYLSNPFTYDIGGRETLVCSVASPIIRGGRVLGAVGAYVIITELFALVDTSSILDDGYLFVVSSDGMFAAHPDDVYRMAHYRDSWLTTENDPTENLLNGEYDSFIAETFSNGLDTDVYLLGTRLTIGNSVNNWMVGAVVPKDTVFAPSGNLLTIIIAIGIFMVLTVGLVIYRTVHFNLKGLPDITSVADRIALGDIISIKVGTSPTKNEIDLLKRAFSKLTNVIKAITGDLEYISRNSVYDSGDFYIDANNYSGSYSRIAEGINELVRKHATVRETLRQNLENVIETEKQASIQKSTFLANMSHEIRTPMNSIMGFSELAIDDDISPVTRDYLQKIHENAKGLLVIINDVLDISKIESGKMEVENIPFDVQELLDNCRSMVMPKAIEKNLVLYFYAEPSTNTCPLGDPVRLRQVLVNLLSNAIKFTNVGTVKLVVEIVNKTNDSITMSFEVKDSGIGMTEEQITRIFNPFSQAEAGTTRKYGGTGLGLSITQKILEAMGGTIEVESTPGIGSKFTFELTFDAVDIKEAEFVDKVSFEEIEKPTFEGEVLLCEDNIMNQQVIFEHLTRVGLKTVIAENGKIGLDLVHERKINNEKQFDIILMDIHMPVMDGLEAVSKILELDTDIPIVALTANIMSEDREIYKKSGMSDYIGKPFTSQELWRCLMRFLAPVDWKKEDTIEQKKRYSLNQHKLINIFLSTNRNCYLNVINALDTGDTQLAHRLVHTLKSNAAQIGKMRLHYTAEVVEKQLKNGENHVSANQLETLKHELDAVITELSSIVQETPQSTEVELLDDTSAVKLLDELKPLLENCDIECLKFIDSLRAIPESNDLIEKMETFDSKVAMELFNDLYEKYNSR